MLNKKFHTRVKEIISDPAFEKPISHLKKDLSQKGVIILVTKIKPQQNELRTQTSLQNTNR